MGRVLFSEESKCARQNDSRRVITWRENRALFHPSNVTKIDSFGGKGILVRDGIMLVFRTTLYGPGLLSAHYRAWCYGHDNERPLRTHIVDEFHEGVNICRMD
ncbi:hypothetical protein TNCV_2863101 [Trichonephila clavipes]|nr:hypothetical protein TNCV_2863101 [Trichonephila clavipes]